MSCENSKVNFFPESVLRNNVSQKYGAENNVRSVHREYFEEFIERKQNQQLRDIAEKCRKAWKKQKKIDKILKVDQKIAVGPQWFQELSDKQLNILQSFGDSMEEDYDLRTSKNTRRMLKTLGVTTFIPHTVAMNALHASELNPVSYLTEIKDFVTSKSETISDQTHIPKDSNIVVDI